MKKNSLNNQVVAITGATGAIGSAISEAIVSQGGKVVLGDLNKKTGKKVLKKLGSKNAIFFYGDLTKTNTIEKFLKQGIRRFGKINSSVHCMYPRSPGWGTKFEKLKEKHLSIDLSNQLGGSILYAQKILKYFKKKGSGNLIFISSIQGVAAPKFEHYKGTKIFSPIEYSAIKSGIIAITKYLSKYYRKSKIRINCISPGGILANQPKRFKINYRKSCNAKGLLDAKDLVGTLTFLLKEDSKYINGQNILIDDGWSL